MWQEPYLRVSTRATRVWRSWGELRFYSPEYQAGRMERMEREEREKERKSDPVGVEAEPLIVCDKGIKLS